MRNRILTITAAIITSVGLSLTFVAPATSAPLAAGAEQLSPDRSDKVSGAMRVQVGVLEVRMDDVEDRLSALEGATPDATSREYGQDAKGDLKARVSVLEREMANVQARISALGGERETHQPGADGKLQGRIDTLDRQMDGAEAQLTILEGSGPTSGPVYAHLPYGPGIGATDWAAMTRDRIDAGWATGAFIYYGPGNPLAWGPEWDAFVEEFPEGVDLMVSPKALNEADLIDFLDRLPQVLRDRMVIAYFQEPEDNHTTPAARAEFRAKVIRYDEITEPYGVANGVQMQTYVIGPTQAHGGDQAIIDMVPADSIDFFGWSVFEFNGNDSGAGHINRARAFMDTNYPGIDWGATSLGFSVPQGTPAKGPLRVGRAEFVDNTLVAMEANSADASSWYDVPVGNENRDFGVDVPLLPVLVETPWQ